MPYINTVVDVAGIHSGHSSFSKHLKTHLFRQAFNYMVLLLCVLWFLFVLLFLFLL